MDFMDIGIINRIQTARATELRVGKGKVEEKATVNDYLKKKNFLG